MNTASVHESIILQIRKGNKERGIDRIIESHPFKLVFKRKRNNKTDLSVSSIKYGAML